MNQLEALTLSGVIPVYMKGYYRTEQILFQLEIPENAIRQREQNNFWA